MEHLIRQTFKKWYLRVFASIALFISSGAYLVCHSQTTASSAMRVYGHGPFVNYNISSEGVEQPVRWGIDTAWLWDWWPLRATNHMRECVTLGRVTSGFCCIHRTKALPTYEQNQCRNRHIRL